MEKSPLVSIITPSYNQAQYLEYTLRSVLEQDYPHIEYLVVDGASSDGSLDIIKKYNSRLSWWVSEPDHGQAEAINKGFRRARGEIIAWLNSDDMYARGAVRKAVQALRSNESCGMVFSNVFSVDAHNEIFNTMCYGDWCLADLMEFNIIGQPGVFMRRSALEKAGYMDMDYHYLLDHQLWLRIAEYYPIRYVDDYFAAARFHPQAKNVAMASEFGREAFKIVEWMKTQPDLQEIFIRNHRKILAGTYRISARYLQDGGSNRQAFADYLRCLWYYPATAFSELRRFVYAFASLVLPLRGLRGWFLERRSKKVREDKLQEYQELFDYAE